MTTLCFLATAIGLFVSLPAWGLLGLTLAAGRQPRFIPSQVSQGAALSGLSPPRVAVLVPAHNESSSVLPTLECLFPQLNSGDRLWVIADNCSDDTARLALEAGATVLERYNPDQRGKGFALAFGVDALREDPPDVVVVIDADCTLSRDAIRKVSQRCIEMACPVQMLDLMHAPAGAGLRIRTQEFAWIVKNYVRPRGACRLGGACHLMGTGMAIPWALISTANLATGHLAEDMKLGIDLAMAGHPAEFFMDAKVSSFFPTDSAAARVQKSRWEHGHLAIMSKELPRLLATALRTGQVALWILALDLAIPPLALYFLLLAVAVPSGIVAGYLVPELQTLAVLMCFTALAFGAAVGLSWQRYARHLLSLRELIFVPFYAALKVPLYLAFAFRQRMGWVRTKRN